jgi:acetaldehyde dehydrogenase (acetylating)
VAVAGAEVAPEVISVDAVAEISGASAEVASVAELLAASRHRVNIWHFCKTTSTIGCGGFPNDSTISRLERLSRTKNS